MFCPLWMCHSSRVVYSWRVYYSYLCLLMFAGKALPLLKLMKWGYIMGDQMGLHHGWLKWGYIMGDQMGLYHGWSNGATSWWSNGATSWVIKMGLYHGDQMGLHHGWSNGAISWVIKWGYIMGDQMGLYHCKWSHCSIRARCCTQKRFCNITVVLVVVK